MTPKNNINDEVSYLQVLPEVEIRSTKKTIHLSTLVLLYGGQLLNAKEMKNASENSTCLQNLYSY